MSPIRRGQVYYAELGPIVDLPVGAQSKEIAFRRPVVVVSADAINRVSDREPFYVLVVPGTTGPRSMRTAAARPTHVLLEPTDILHKPSGSGLRDPGVFLAHQMRSVDSRRLDPDPVGWLTDAALTRVEAAIRYCLFGS